MYSFRRLLPYLRQYRWHMVVVIFSAVGITTMSMIYPWLMRELVQIIRTETVETATGHVIALVVILVAAYIARAVFRFLYMYIAHIVAYNFVGDLRVIVYNHLQQLSSRFFADRQTGEILKRVVSDTRDIEPLIAHYIPDMTINILMLIGVGIILFSLNPILALLTLLPMPLLLISNLFFGKRMREALKDASGRLGRLTGVVQDNLVGIKEIQLFTQEEREHQRINVASTDTTRVQLYGLKMQALLTPSIEFLTSMGLVIIVLFGGRAALNGTMPVGDLVAFVLYLSMFYQPITVMAQMTEMLHVAITGADHVVEMLDIQPDVDDLPGAVDPGRLRGEVEFKHVTFEYNEHIH